jgi:hypothetical protein
MSKGFLDTILMDWKGLCRDIVERFTTLPSRKEEKQMGMFRVEVQAVGGHGCQRQIKDGQQVQNYCGSPGCPDCVAREFVRALKRTGAMVEKAEIIHWPGQTSEVRDDMLSGVRTGNF